MAALRYRYHDVLTKRDLTVRGGNIRMQEVVAIFIDRIPPEEQSRLRCDLILQSTDHWLARLLRAPRVAQHPLHHLLVMYMLNITARDFFEPLLSAALDTTLPMKFSGGVSAPFGAPPWPCLNPASNHYRELRIAQYEDAAFQYPEGRALPPPRARFACDCGFVYLRTGPDQTHEDHFRYDQVERYGWVWEQRLAQLWSDQAISLRSIAKSLQVSTRTVTRYVALAGLSDRPAKHAAADVQQRHDEAPTTDSKASALLIPDTRVVESKHATPGASVRQIESRKVWLDAIAIQPGVGVKGLRRQFPAIYAWLYRHDRDWLRAHTPLRQIANPQSNRRVNWKTRDEQFALAVQEAAQRLLSRDGKPVRLSKSALIRETGQSSMIFEKIDKLPRTAAILILMSESREAFAVRRIQITATQFLREQVIPRQWQLVRRAGVERLIHVDSVVRALAEAFAVMRYPVLPLDLT